MLESRSRSTSSSLVRQRLPNCAYQDAEVRHREKTQVGDIGVHIDRYDVFRIDFVAIEYSMERIRKVDDSKNNRQQNQWRYVLCSLHKPQGVLRSSFDIETVN